MSIAISINATGPDPQTDTVLQIGAVSYSEDGKEGPAFGTFVQPPGEVSDQYLLEAGIGLLDVSPPLLPQDVLRERRDRWPTPTRAAESLGRFIARNEGGFHGTLEHALRNSTFLFFDATAEAPFLSGLLAQSGLFPEGMREVNSRSLLHTFRDHGAILSYIGSPWEVPDTLEAAAVRLGAKSFNPTDATARAGAVGNCFFRNDARLRKIYEAALRSEARGPRRASSKAPVIRPKGPPL